MKLLRFFLLTALILIASVLAFGQDTAPLTPDAPPDVDKALRARVTQFYSANITGKWRDAFQVVADDMQDTYLQASKDSYDRCETMKITYTDNFSKATVRENCHGEYRWHNSKIPATVPLTSTWKQVDGQWFWYYLQPTEVMTPWGLSIVTPEAPRPTSSVNTTIQQVVKDPTAMAKAILSQVKVDKKELHLSGFETSKAELNIINTMAGTISVTVNCPPLPGFHIKPDKLDVAQNVTTPISFEYDADEAKQQCGDCYKLPKPILTAVVRVQPTAQFFNVKIVFGIQPEIEKKLPKELRPAAPKQHN